MKVLVALAVLVAVAHGATVNFYQPVSFQPTNQQPIEIMPSLPEVYPAPEGPVYHEINVPSYEGAPMVIIKVNVIKSQEPTVEETPAFSPADWAKPMPAFSPADLVKPMPEFSPADLVKPMPPVFSPADLTKPMIDDDYAPAEEMPFENEWAAEHMPHEIQAGPLVKIIVNIEN